MPACSRFRSLVAAALATTLLATAARAGTIVHFATNLGSFDVELYDSTMPITVANFLTYVNSDRYDSTIIHRSTTHDPAGIQVLQGGGYLLSGNQLLPVTTDPPIAFESSTANLRGTIAMARGAGLNTATSQWFFNVTDNPALDFNYAVFGQVTGTGGLAVLDSIAAVPVYDCTVQLGAAFSELPLTTSTLEPTSLVLVNSVAAVPEPSTLAVVAVGGLAVAAFIRRRTN